MMNRSQIENLYKVNGLTDYKLKTHEDLLKCHGINFKIDGYSRLNDIDRAIYEKFILNIFNVFGLESRATLIPKGIYLAEQVDYLAKEDPEDDYYIVVGETIYTIDKNGLKTVHRTWKDEDYKHLESTIVEGEGKRYLRFEYEHDGRNEWLHVINNGKEWY